MNKNFLYLSLIFVMTLSTLSCQKKSTGIKGPENGGLEDFPNAVGSRFVYFYFDSLSMSSDVVVASIVGTTTLDDTNQATVWEYTYSSKIDTKYVYLSGDAVRIYDDLETWWVNTKYIFPLEVGEGWRGDFASDTNTVIDKVLISVPAGEFPNTFVIEESWGALNEYGHVLTWFVPKVGIIKKHHSSIGWTAWTRETWKLVEYHISPSK